MFLGIDIGTSNVKAVIVDDGQRIVATATAPIPISRPQELWSEQHPEDWWAAADSAVQSLRQAASADLGAVQSIGVSGQMHGLVLLDGSGRPLRPAILHNDGRSFAEATELNARVPAFGRIAGVPAMPGFAAPKIMWVARHEPDVLERTRQILLPKDYVRFRLTGAYATDMCDGSGSVLLDSGRRDWSREIIAACGIDAGILPPVLEGTAIAGELDASVARAWGMRAGIPVTTGTGDAAAGAIGAGAINEGDAFISLGTAAQYFITRQRYRPAPEHLIHTFCHGLPSRWFQMAALLNGASVLPWVAGLLGEHDIPALLAKTEAQFSGPSPVTFLPYLSGERTPHNNPHAKGVLFGLSASTTPHQVVQAVLEGLALALADCQALLAQTGPLPDAIAATGGGSKNRFWMKLLASAIGRTVLLHEGGETGPAFGAARMARLAVTSETPDTVCTKPPVAATIDPDPALADAYAGRLEKFRALYRAIAEQF